MAREDSFNVGRMYGNEGLTLEEYNNLVRFFLDHFGQTVANGFIEGYHQAIAE